MIQKNENAYKLTENAYLFEDEEMINEAILKFKKNGTDIGKQLGRTDKDYVFVGVAEKENLVVIIHCGSPTDKGLLMIMIMDFWNDPTPLYEVQDFMQKGSGPADPTTRMFGHIANSLTEVIKDLPTGKISYLGVKAILPYN